MTITTEKEITARGILKGILLDSWKFDFMFSDGKTITGNIDEGLTEAQVSKFITKYFNKQCNAFLKEGKVLFKNGREKISHVLVSIEP